MSDTIAKLRDLLLNSSKAGRLRGLLDSIYGAASTGAEAYGSASSPMSAEHSGLLGGLLMDMSPLGDAKSAYDGVQSAREGDWLGAGLGGLGALPMVPNLAGWTVHKMGDIKIIENPTREMAKNLAERSNYGELKGIKDPTTGYQYWWDAGILNHDEVAKYLGLDWDAILKGSDQTRLKQSIKSIDGTPWKFSGE